MIVVSDASPLHYLILIGTVDVLPQVFGTVIVPPAVLLELQHAKAPEAVRAWALQPPDWLHRKHPTSIDISLNLDPGEQEAISLAIELQADALLIDERKGRIVAGKKGLLTLGTLAVLEIAAEKGLIEIRAVIERLLKTSFRADERIIKQLLAP